MKYSKLFGKTVREAPRDARATSYKLLYKAGYIRESTGGRFFFLPLGMRVADKIKAIIQEEMDKAGAQKMVSPVLHPLSLWEETNRTKTTGFELMAVKDRRGAQFALGGTAEEMFVDVVRKFNLTYKDLPINIYQFSEKFRDELRARGGLLRVREFVMKDAYSFDVDEESFKKEYDKMAKTYSRIFDRMGLPTKMVLSDNGYIGGEYCHEFVVESEVGESKFLESKDGKYSAHEDVAKFHKEEMNLDEKLQDLVEVDAPRGNTMKDGVKFHKLPLWRQIKDVLYRDENGRYILAVIRGDFDINEVKLKKLVNCVELVHADDGKIRSEIGSEPGFISPVGIKKLVRKGVDSIIIADDSLRTVHNLYGGANAKNRDALNMNIDRDFKADIEGDIALAKDGYLTQDSKQELIEKKGIEVGNIFQLGHHYSKKMKGATFVDKDGKNKPYYMGCYGIGIGRTLATIVEVYSDDKGIKWPMNVSPYQVYLAGLNLEDKDVKKSAEDLYINLQKADIEVLYDDREDTSAGVKLGDADLIGIPIRLVVSKKTLYQNSVELKLRREDKTKLLKFDKIQDAIFNEIKGGDF